MIRINGKTYTQQYRQCNKPTCKCHNGEPHGPYWYERHENGRVRYIGKHLPESVLRMQEMQREASAELAGLRADLSALRKRVDTLDRFCSGSALDEQDLALVEMLMHRAGYNWTVGEAENGMIQETEFGQ